MPSPLKLSRQDVRRLAVSRQHLADATPQPMLDVIRDLGCLQLDPIRAVERTHLLVLWSRLGLFDRAELAELRWQQKALFEYWAHAASMVLTEEYPVHHWRMRRARQRSWQQRGLDGDEQMLNDLLAHILQRLEHEGPLPSRAFDSQDGMVWTSGWTSGRFVNRLLDNLWDRGKVVVAGREGNQRLWGLADQFLPADTPRAEWSDEEVCRFAAQKAIRALGAATLKQIKLHYTRNRYPNLPDVLTQLVAEGVVLPVEVAGADGLLPGPYYLHRDDLPLLEQLRAGQWQPRTTLLSPFDNLICDRDRTEALFDFYFRIEIYVPKAKRQFGYYVLPILHGDRLIGRIDPKMDRKTKTLHVHAVYAEAGAPDGTEVVTAVANAIDNLAQFLGADSIEWGDVPPQWQRLVG